MSWMPKPTPSGSWSSNTEPPEIAWSPITQPGTYGAFQPSAFQETAFQIIGGSVWTPKPVPSE